MSTKEIRMSYEEYHADLAKARSDGWENAREQLRKAMKLTKDEIDMQSYRFGERSIPDSEVLQEIFERFFVY